MGGREILFEQVSPQMKDTLITHDVYARNTDKDGKRFVSCHRVWDGDRFFASLQKAAAKDGGTAEQITHEQYMKERTK